MATNVKTTMQVSITATDINNQQPVTRTITVVQNGAAGNFELCVGIPNADYTVQLPVTPIQALMIKNNAAAGNVTVMLIPNGGASATVVVLGPGGVFTYADPTVGASNGFTEIKLNASVAALPVEMYIGG